MDHRSLRKAMVWKKLAAMALSFVAVVVGVTVLSAIMLGYGFNSKDGRVERRGILQVDSRPNGASVFVNGQQQSSNTRARLVLSEADYDLRIEKQNYRPWQKKVHIKGGELTWAAYPRLIPNQLPVQQVADLPATLADALPSGGSKFYAFLESAAKPQVRIARLDRDELEFKTAELPADMYEKPTEQYPDSAFSLHLWSGNERFILLKHMYHNKEKTEWLLLDTDKPDDSMNLTRLFGVSDMKELVFGSHDGKQLYAMIDRTVRALDTSSRTISAPLAEHVENFRLFGDGYVLFVSHAPGSALRTIGYTKKDYKQARVIDGVPYHAEYQAYVDVAKYYNTYYFLIANGKEASLSSSKNLPGDNPQDILSRTLVTTLSTEHPIIAANITENGQLAMVQDGSMYATYNLESTQTHRTQLKPNAAGVAQKFRHLDTHLVWADNAGTLRTYEFDGANQQDIMPVVAAFDATLSPSGKYLYGVAKQGDAYVFARVQLLDV